MFRFFTGLFLSVSTLFSGVGSHTASLVSQVTHMGSATSSVQTTLTQDQLLSLASDKYADGNLPLGDNKYVTDSPKKGYIYLCNVQTNSAGGAQTAGSWIHGTTWNIKEKISVSGSVHWQSAFSDGISGDTRTISGNDLPTHTTGIFPIQSTDAAYKYDHNPNSIKTQSFTQNLPANPTYSDTPYCMGGEVGVMTTGVALFDGFDAGYRDAAAWEVQDGCSGHPQVSGEYHYHSLSSCITDTSVSSVIGFALDGFPITGPKVADGKYLTTDNLDECHGITSSILLDGKTVTMYHYVMTEDFPYSVSCFRGKPVSMQLISGGMGGQNGGSKPSGSPQGGNGNSHEAGPMNTFRPMPPQVAIDACSGKSSGATCSFTAPKGTITGTCLSRPVMKGQSIMACAENNPVQVSGAMPPPQMPASQ